MSKVKKNIAMIFGGKSSEHAVSLSSAREVARVIDQKKYHIVFVAVLHDGRWIIGDSARTYMETEDHGDLSARNDVGDFVTMAHNHDIDLILPILHGAYGEDGRMQGFLDTLGVPYVFSGHLAHALGMDKARSKVIVAAQGVPVVTGQIVHKSEGHDIDAIVDALGLPLVVKPNDAGSSIGISMVEEKDRLCTAIDVALHYSDIAIIEQRIAAREMTIGVIEKDGVLMTLPVIEIVPQSAAWYDYEAKYSAGGSKHICPADIPHDLSEQLSEYARQAFVAIGCRDMARVDLLWDGENDQIYFLEINTIPGMTATSLVPDAAAHADITFDDLVNGLIAQALKR